MVEADGDSLTHPDFLTLGPDGKIYTCEDDYSLRHDRICQIDPENGEVYDFALNLRDSGEMSGLCFSPDGRAMFANLYDPGLTLVITQDAKGPSEGAV